jgi:hypothetical protein
MKNILSQILAGIIVFIGVLGLIAIIGLLMSWPLMLLWNGCLVGTIDGIGPITSIWQSWGILILCGLLFKSSNTTTNHHYHQ